MWTVEIRTWFDFEHQKSDRALIILHFEVDKKKTKGEGECMFLFVSVDCQAMETDKDRQTHGIHISLLIQDKYVIPLA